MASALKPQEDEIPPLSQRLAADGAGALRDELLDELALAGADIETALGRESNAIQTQTLRDLLEVIRISEGVVAETWSSLHP